MSLVIGGGDAIVWSASSSTFPYFKGFAVVITSWFVSPILAGIVVAILWVFMRPIMRSKHSFVISFWLLPLFVTATIALITAFIMQVGGKNGTWPAQSDGTIAWVCIVVGVGCGLITLVCFMPFIKKRALADEAKLQERYVVYLWDLSLVVVFVSSTLAFVVGCALPRGDVTLDVAVTSLFSLV